MNPFYIAVAIVFVLWSFTVPVVNSFVLTNLSEWGAISGPIINHPWIAGFTEPIWSKLVPIALVWYTGTWIVGILLAAFVVTSYMIVYGVPSPLGLLVAVGVFPALTTLYLGKTDNLTPRANWLIAPVAGFLFGLWELYFRNWQDTGEFNVWFWEYATYSVTQIGPVLYHVLEGTIVVGAFLTMVTRDRSWWYVGGALVVAGSLHIVLNTWLLEQMWFWESLSEVLT
jgi:hypothetical protein